MNAEIFENELFIKIKDLIQDNKRILDESIGKTDYAGLLSLTEEELPLLRTLANLWLEKPEKQEDRIIWDVAVIAWRSAAAVNINEAVHLMLDLLEETEKLKLENDALSEDFIYCGEMADKATTAFLCDFIQLKSYDDWTTISAVEALNYALENNPDMKNIVKDAMTKRFMDYENNSSDLNAFLIDRLTDLGAVELAEEMEKAFAAGKVDESHMGIWGDIRKRLGVPGAGLVPDGVRITPDPFKGFAENLKKLAALNRAEEQQWKKKLKNPKKRKKKNLKKIRKMKRKAKR
jgi:hypothetical protein